MLGVGNVISFELAFSCKIQAKPSVRVRASTAHGQSWMSSACWHTRKQVLGVDLWQVPRQDSTRNTYALEHDPAQSRIASPRRETAGSSTPLRVEKVTERQLVMRRIEAVYIRWEGGKEGEVEVPHLLATPS